MTDNAPLLRLTGMYENTSAKSGETYYAGYLGGAKILLLRNKKATGTEPTWTLCLCQRPEKATATAPRPAQSYPQHRSAASQPPAVDPTLDDSLPDWTA